MDSAQHADAPAVPCKDRERGAFVYEPRCEDAAIDFLYGEGFWSRAARRIVRRPFISKLLGLAHDLPATRRGLQRFADRWKIDLREAEKPLSGYRTRNELFSRRLKDGVRPVDQTPGALVSPADAKLLVYPRLDGVRVAVKGGHYSIAELIRDNALAQRFSGGCAAVFRLAPRDYHRFHFPDGGTADRPRRIAGSLDSVAPQALARDPKLFCHNKRDVVLLESDNFKTIALVVVGATFVGSIVETHVPGRVERGQEQGYFEFGGSSVVMLCEPGAVAFDDDLVQNSSEGVETIVRMGTRIATIRNP